MCLQRLILVEFVGRDKIADHAFMLFHTNRSALSLILISAEVVGELNLGLRILKLSSVTMVLSRTPYCNGVLIRRCRSRPSSMKPRAASARRLS